MKPIITFLLMLLSVASLNAQDRWMNIYHDEDNAPKIKIINSYDNGILITLRQKPNWPRYTYLIKTGINGEILWEKTIGDGYNVLLNGGLGMNSDGDIYFSGSYGLVGAYDDPMIMKLNACGEKEWCWLFPTEGHHDYGADLCVTPDGGVAALLTLTNPVYYDDRICLARFTSSGEFLWKRCYNPNDTVAMGNEYPISIITTPDYGFLITGFTGYSNPEDSLAYNCPYFIKTDSLGEMEWYTVAGFHPWDIDGSAWTTEISPDSNYYYSSIRHNYWNPERSAPGLLKMDMNGNIVDVYDLDTPDEIGTMWGAKFINDSLLMANMAEGTSWSATTDLVIFDTLGNINERTTIDINTTWLASTEVTYDGKLLYYIEGLDENDEWDSYLFKYNQNLESDTLYSQWYNYDSLCPYQITSDTIPIEGCGLIVGDREIKAEVEIESLFKVFPNPAKDYFVIENLFPQSNQKIVVSITDMRFREIERIEINSNETETRISTINYGAGVYLIRFYVNGELWETKKINIIK